MNNVVVMDVMVHVIMQMVPVIVYLVAMALNVTKVSVLGIYIKYRINEKLGGRTAKANFSKFRKANR